MWSPNSASSLQTALPLGLRATGFTNLQGPPVTSNLASSLEGSTGGKSTGWGGQSQVRIPPPRLASRFYHLSLLFPTSKWGRCPLPFQHLLRGFRATAHPSPQHKVGHSVQSTMLLAVFMVTLVLRPIYTAYPEMSFNSGTCSPINSTWRCNTKVVEERGALQTPSLKASPCHIISLKERQQAKVPSALFNLLRPRDEFLKPKGPET